MVARTAAWMDSSSAGAKVGDLAEQLAAKWA